MQRFNANQSSMKTFYTRKQVASNEGCYSPSARKPRVLLEYLAENGFALDVVDPTPATMEDLCRAHAEEYVSGVLDCKRKNGFGNRDAEVARSLPYTSGSLVRAAKAALTGERLTFSPTSGFHHAGYNFGGDFCTFNGLMVTALHLHAHALANRVAIIDCDEHFGNGTEDIVERLGCRAWCHTSGCDFTEVTEWDYVHAVEKHLLEVIAFQPDVIIYQAGADPHVDDPLGGRLTTAQMAERDRLVFGAAVQHRIPLAWNLAGGYQRGGYGNMEPVLKLHQQTYEIALEAWRQLQGTMRS